MTRNKSFSQDLPFDGFSFFTSGIGDTERSLINYLGGKVITEVDGKAFISDNVCGQLFFVSKSENYRKHKYLLAAALGVPMLHVSWLSAMKSLYDTYKSNKEKNIDVKLVNPSVFNSSL